MKPLNASTGTRQVRPVTILQLGAGNFLRAFVDWMIEKSNETGITDHGIAVAHVTDRPDRAAEILAEQDGFFHVYLEGVENGALVKDVTLVTAVQTVVNAHTEFEKFREIYLSADLTTIVSNTTEAGIQWVAGDDLAAHPPQSFPAKMTALLHDRWEHFAGDPTKGLAVVCCELIEDNGSTLRSFVLRHATENRLEPEFIAWVEDCCDFYDTLVDRIVPGFPRDDIDRIKEEIGYDDNLVVKGEFFYVWAVGGSPRIRELLPLDKAGLNVLFMDDIRPFRAKKVRILNGAHTALAAVALQLGRATVVEADETPIVKEYVRRLVADEVLPTIPGDPAELSTFATQILERFANPFLQHRLADISLNSLSKWATRNLPVALDTWHGRGSTDRSATFPAPLTAFALAAILVLYSGRSELPEFVPVDEEALVALIRDASGTARDAGEDASWVPAVVDGLGWSADLPPEFHTALRAEVTRNVQAILDLGIDKALQGVLRKVPEEA